MKSNSLRAEISIYLIWAVLSMEILSFLSSCYRLSLLLLYNTYNIFKHNLIEEIISYLYSATYIVSGVAFLLWFTRAYYNIHQKVIKLKFAKEWAIIAWFVPILNLIRPYELMKELFDETYRILKINEKTFQPTVKADDLKSWWTLFVVYAAIGKIVSYYSSRANSANEFLMLTLISMFDNILAIPLTILVIKIIKNYSELERLLIDNDLQ